MECSIFYRLSTTHYPLDFVKDHRLWRRRVAALDERRNTKPLVASVRICARLSVNAVTGVRDLLASTSLGGLTEISSSVTSRLFLRDGLQVITRHSLQARESLL